MDSLLARESLKVELHRSGDGSDAVSCLGGFTQSSLTSDLPQLTSIMLPVADASQASSDMMSTGSQRQSQVQRTAETGNSSTSNCKTAKGKVVPPLV